MKMSLRGFLWNLTVMVFACSSGSRLFVFCIVPPVEAVTTIYGRLQYPDKSPFNVTTKITLNHGEFTTYCRLDDGCSFALYGVPPGVHQLDVHSTSHHFAHVKIQVVPSENGVDEIKCLEYVFAGANKKPVKHPLELTAYATYDYFEVRHGFSFMMILSNPMVIMMAVSIGMMFMLPKMMEGLDPEERAQMKKQIEMQQDPSKMLNSLWEGFSGEPEKPKPKTIKKQQ